MRVIVVGADHSGTNWALEIVRFSGTYEFTEAVQDPQFFEYERLPENYGTKIPTEHKDFTLRHMKKIMHRNDKMKVIFTTRHPIDLALSKMYRGQPSELGGDTPGYSPDANPLGALHAIESMYLMWKHMNLRWPNRMLTVRLEDLILDPEKPVGEICAFLDIAPVPEMNVAYRFIRVEQKHTRYRYRIHRDQVGLHKRWDSIYDGYFKQKESAIVMLKKELAYVVEGMGYE